MRTYTIYTVIRAYLSRFGREKSGLGLLRLLRLSDKTLAKAALHAFSDDSIDRVIRLAKARKDRRLKQVLAAKGCPTSEAAAIRHMHQWDEEQGEYFYG